MAEVICAGVAFLDHVFRVGGGGPPGNRAFAEGYRPTGGGMAATAAVAVARLGGEAALWSRLGDDAAGRLILDELATFGVDTTGVRIVSGAQSPVSAVTIETNGERKLVVYPGAGLDASPEWLPLGRIEETSAVLVDCRWPEAAEAVLARATDHRVPALLDAELGPEPVPTLLVALASHVVFSRDGLAQFTGIDDVPRALSAAARRTRGFVGATAGAEGFYWFEPGAGTRHLPAPAIETVDTLGAGDVFHGAFALALGEGKDVETAARFATVAASLACTGHGRAAIPDRAAVWGVLDGDRRAARMVA